MLEIPKFYNFKSNIILINGIRIQGFGDEGGVEYEFADDAQRHTSGADGQVTVSRVNDYRMIATFTVKETSTGYTILSALMQDQLAVTDRLNPLPYVHIDPVNGDLIRSSHAVFLTWPEPSKARDAGDREFQILLPNAAAEVIFGPRNVQLL